MYSITECEWGYVRHDTGANESGQKLIAFPVLELTVYKLVLLAQIYGSSWALGPCKQASVKRHCQLWI